LDHAYDPGPSKPGVDLVDVEALELVGDEGCRLVLLKDEFRVSVEVTAPSRHAVMGTSWNAAMRLRIGMSSRLRT
jgi:hypothetical protein